MDEEGTEYAEEEEGEGQEYAESLGGCGEVGYRVNSGNRRGYKIVADYGYHGADFGMTKSRVWSRNYGESPP